MEADRAVEPAHTEQPVAAAKTGEAVLVVEDEPDIRLLLVELLQDAGYAVIAAADAASAMQTLQSGVRLDLLLSDVGLPGGMDGRQLADAARAVRPALKVLFVTGYAENAATWTDHLAPGMQVMTKPFDITTLMTRVRDIVGT